MHETPRSWVCPSCRVSRVAGYCADCGEAAPQRRALTWRAVAAKGVQALTSIDGKLLRSSALLLRRPGALTLAHVDGPRMPYLAPVPLFLLANALFFAVQSLTGLASFSSTLDSHLHRQDWRELAQQLVALRLQHPPHDLARYAPEFDRAVVLYAKSLVVLMAMPFALLTPLVYRAARAPMVAHVAFALHLYTFWLLVFCIALIAAKADALLGGGGIDAPVVDNVLSVLNLVACGVYVHLSSARVFGQRGPMQVVKAVVLAVAAGAIVIGYRFLLLPITLLLT